MTYKGKLIKYRRWLQKQIRKVDAALLAINKSR